MIARVVLESPLPQLDKLFDYEVPQDVVVHVGYRVAVPFGRSKRPHEGFVVEVVEASDYSGKLAAIQEVVSTIPAFDFEHYLFLRALADRQSGTVGELLKLSLPKRAVRAEKAFALGSVADRPAEESISQTWSLNQVTSRATCVIQPRTLEFASPEGAAKPISVQVWLSVFASRCAAAVQGGRSALAVVPDFRDRHRLIALLADLGYAPSTIEYSSEQTPSDRYKSFLKASQVPGHIIVSSRGAALLPVAGLSDILLWDDLDQALEEPSAPYFHAREALLLRQQLSDVRLLIAGHSRSAELQRLVNLDYLEDATMPFAAPRVVLGSEQRRISTAATDLIKACLQVDKPVLIQVATPGVSAGIYCKACDQQLRCQSCHGPIREKSVRNHQCHWCSALVISPKCSECGSNSFRNGRPGSSRTLADFGKMFPNINLVESTGENTVLSVPSGRRIVVSTPGCEPTAAGGYAGLVILDADLALGKPSLRATERAVQRWSNAASFLGTGGRVVIDMPETPLMRKLLLWQQVEIAQAVLEERAELGLPPHYRLGTVSGPMDQLEDLARSITEARPAVTLLGPTRISESESRLTMKFDYSTGMALSRLIRSYLFTSAAGLVGSSHTGRARRALKVKMDDYEVV